MCIRDRGEVDGQRRAHAFEGGVEAQFLARFAAGGLTAGLPGERAAAGAEVPPAGPRRLRLLSPLNEHAALTVEDADVDDHVQSAVGKTAEALHLFAGGAAVLIVHVEVFHGHTPLSAKP